MYRTVFVLANKDGYEDRDYKTKREAFRHLELFKRDDSGIYKYVYVADDKKKLVYGIIVFESGSPRFMIKLQDVVRINAEQAKRGEQKLLYAVQKIDVESETFEISCVKSRGSVEPTRVVPFLAVTPVTATLEEVLNGARA